MQKTTATIYNAFKKRMPALQCCEESIKGAFYLLRESFLKGGKLLLCGNGGSAADCQHIVGELMKSFILKRPIPPEQRQLLRETFPEESLSDQLQGALPAISLISHSSLYSALLNDVGCDLVFAQQVYGFGKEGDVLLAISTSGNARNVILAAKTARAFGMKTIALTGRSGGGLAALCDIAVKVPADETAAVQEYHQPVYHALCAMLEAEFFAAPQ